MGAVGDVEGRVSVMVFRKGKGGRAVVELDTKSPSAVTTVALLGSSSSSFSSSSTVSYSSVNENLGFLFSFFC